MGWFRPETHQDSRIPKMLLHDFITIETDGSMGDASLTAKVRYIGEVFDWLGEWVGIEFVGNQGSSGNALGSYPETRLLEDKDVEYYLKRKCYPGRMLKTLEE